MAAGTADRNPVEVLSEEFLERIRRGEAVTPEEYARKHPELADEILTLFPALLMMEELGDETSDLTSSQGALAGTNVGAAAGRIGEFRLLREVGRGGMGVVYEAEQESLGRRVALKVLPSGALTDLKQIRRFEREARSAARLHHTNIVPIFGVGEHEGTHFYVMQFIQGQGLDAVLSELKRLRDAREGKSIQPSVPDRPAKGRAAAADIAQSLVTGRFGLGNASAGLAPGGSATEAWSTATTARLPDSASQSDRNIGAASSTSAVSTLSETDRRFAQGVARIGVQVAEALAHAHAQGILHRDIKPSNLLLDREGTVWVTDFGLAKAVGGEDLTHTGDIVGTLRYMAPERFQGSGDLRADLYALGLTLYELLALRPAFDESDRASLIRQVTQEDPPRLRKLNRHVPHDLETIIHKSIARDPRQRYENARALADDLQRFLDGRPILARRVSASERLYRWARRNKGLAASLFLSALLLVGISVASLISAAWFRNTAGAARIAAADAEVSRSLAEAAQRRAERAGNEAEARRLEADAQRSRAQRSLAEAQANLGLARKAVDDSFTKVSESTLLSVPGLRPLRRALLESALSFYEELIERGGEEPGVVADLAATQARVGQILADLAQSDKARAAFKRAVELYDKTLSARPGDVNLLEHKSEVWHRLGDLDYQTDQRTANAAYRQAIAIRQRLADEHPTEPRFRMALSRSFNGLAISDRGPAQLDAYRRSLELRLKLAGEIPEDADLLHGLSESFLNLGIVLRQNGHQAESLELARRSIEYGRAGLARRPHDREFATDLAASYTEAANGAWQIGSREETLSISADGIAYIRKLSAENPDLPSYRGLLANMLAAHAQYCEILGRTVEAISFGKQAAETFESIPDSDRSFLLSAAFMRIRLAAQLEPGFATKEFKSWNEEARREADLAVADLRAAAAKGFQDVALIRRDSGWRHLLAREDVKSLLAEMERPAKEPRAAKVGATRNDSPLHSPGRLEDDRFLGELTIDLTDSIAAAADESRLEALLVQVEARRKAGNDSPMLAQAARSIQFRIGDERFKAGDLAVAKGRWDLGLAPLEKLPQSLPKRQAVVVGSAPALARMIDLVTTCGLWELAEHYEALYRAGEPAGRSYRSFDSGLLALRRGDQQSWRAITEEALRDFGQGDHFWTFNALRTANLSANAPVAPEKLVEIARRLVAKGRGDRWYSWHRIELGHALFRAGQDQAALSELVEFGFDSGAAPVIALIHARAGQAERARRWLTALEQNLEQTIRDEHLAKGGLKSPYLAHDVLRAELLRREAYAVLGTKAPELRALQLLRGDSFWRLGDHQKAETEFAAAIADAADDADAIIDRAWTFEGLGLRVRSMADLALAARRRTDDPRPWVAKGRLLAARGLQSEADEAYARAAAIAPGRLDPFLEAPWWVVAHYPGQMNWQSRPEEDHDPFRSVMAESGAPQRWKPANVTPDRGIRLARLAGEGNSSVYALAHLYSATDRTALFCLSVSGTARVWLNGRVIFDPDGPSTDVLGLDHIFPGAMRAGRNTLLVRVSNTALEHWLRFRSDDFELVRAHLFAESARWQEAADLFDLAEKRGQFLDAWTMARQLDVRAALGEEDRYRRAAARLADWDGPIRPDPHDLDLPLGLLPNDSASPERLVEIARASIAMKPDQPWRKPPLALALYRAGKYREAIDQLAPAAPGSSGSHHIEAPIRAMALWKLGKKDEARKSLEQVDGEFDRWCRERLSGRGTSWTTWSMDGPELVTLRREAHSLVEGKPTDDFDRLARVRSAMAGLLADRESPTWAFEAASRLEPTKSAHLIALANRLNEIGRSAAAERVILAATEAKPDDPRGPVERGTFFATVGQPDRAAADFARALERIPQDFATWGDRAKLCITISEHRDAFDRLLKLRPTDALLWYIRAERHLLRREYQGALADFTRGGEPPATSEFAFAFAATLLLASDESAYRDYVTRQADQHGESSEAATLFVLARMAMLAESPPVAPDRLVLWANRAAQKDPTFAWYAHVQALALFRAGEIEAAAAALKRAKKLGWSAGGRALNEVVTAMLERRRGRGSNAMAALAAARPVFARTPTAHIQSDVVILDGLEFQVLRGQIEGPLEDAAFPADPFAGGRR
jgi:eukaryotic-like serine/threonine-protein kinase